MELKAHSGSQKEGSIEPITEQNRADYRLIMMQARSITRSEVLHQTD